MSGLESSMKNLREVEKSGEKLLNKSLNVAVSTEKMHQQETSSKLDTQNLTSSSSGDTVKVTSKQSPLLSANENTLPVPISTNPELRSMPYYASRRSLSSRPLLTELSQTDADYPDLMNPIEQVIYGYGSHKSMEDLLAPNNQKSMQLEDLKQTLEEARSNLSLLEEKIQIQQEKLESLSNDFFKQESKVNKVEASIQNKQTEDSFYLSIENKYKEIETIDGKIERKTSEMNGIEGRLGSWHKKIYSLDKEQIDLKKTSKHTEQLLQQKGVEKQYLENMLKLIKKMEEVSNIKKKIKGSENQLEQEKSVVTQKIQSLEQLSKDSKSIKDEITSLKTAQSSDQAKLSEVYDEIQKLERNLEEAQSLQEKKLLHGRNFETVRKKKESFDHIVNKIQLKEREIGDLMDSRKIDDSSEKLNIVHELVEIMKNVNLVKKANEIEIITKDLNKDIEFIKEYDKYVKEQMNILKEWTKKRNEHVNRTKIEKGLIRKINELSSQNDLYEESRNMYIDLNKKVHKTEDKLIKLENISNVINHAEGMNEVATDKDKGKVFQAVQLLFRAQSTEFQEYIGSDTKSTIANLKSEKSRIKAEIRSEAIENIEKMDKANKLRRSYIESVTHKSFARKQTHFENINKLFQSDIKSFIDTFNHSKVQQYNKLEKELTTYSSKIDQINIEICNTLQDHIKSGKKDRTLEHIEKAQKIINEKKSYHSNLNKRSKQKQKNIVEKEKEHSALKNRIEQEQENIQEKKQEYVVSQEKSRKQIKQYQETSLSKERECSELRKQVNQDQEKLLEENMFKLGKIEEDQEILQGGEHEHSELKNHYSKLEKRYADIQVILSSIGQQKAIEVENLRKNKALLEEFDKVTQNDNNLLNEKASYITELEVRKEKLLNDIRSEKQHPDYNRINKEKWTLTAELDSERVKLQEIDRQRQELSNNIKLDNALLDVRTQEIRQQQENIASLEPSSANSLFMTNIITGAINALRSYKKNTE